MTNRIFIAILGIAAFSASCGGNTSEQPSDVETFVDRREMCDHFRGEEPFDSERAEFLAKQIAETCTGTDEELRNLTAKYSDNDTILQLLNRFEHTIEPKFYDRVDSCDLRAVFGTCIEYTLSELDDWYRKHVATACPNNRRRDNVGAYKEDLRCPDESRVARCEGIVEDPAERYEYDKHYYTGTADGYSWAPGNVQVTCERIAGHFVTE